MASSSVKDYKKRKEEEKARQSGQLAPQTDVARYIPKLRVLESVYMLFYYYMKIDGYHHINAENAMLFYCAHAAER